MNQLKSLEQAVEVITRVMGTLEAEAFNQEGFSDLSMRQLLYLETIARMERPTFSELAENLGVTKPSVTAIVQKLTRLGYVEKVQSQEDRRVYHIALRERGQQFTEMHHNVHKLVAQRLMERLDDAEVQQLVGLFQKVIRP